MGQPHLPHIFYILIMDIKIIIGLIITGIVIFGLLFYLFFRKIKKNISSLNEQVNNLKSCKEVLKEEVTEYAIKKENLTTEISENSRLLDILKVEKDGLSTNIEDLKKQAQDAANIFYQQTMDLANTRIEKDIDIAEKNYQEAIDNYKIEYEKILSDLANDFTQFITEQESNKTTISADIEKSLAELQDLRDKMTIIINSKKIAEQEGLKKDFYRCAISEIDVKEIAQLRAVEPYLRNPRPISKVIWENYYRDSFTALLDRILPLKKSNVSGIYKITNLINDKVYIGQSVNLADRLRNHAKAGIGIDAPNLKMYADMKEFGVENFLFEILETCPPAQLNEKEKYWIEFYHGQDFGYNITKGGSQKITS